MDENITFAKKYINSHNGKIDSEFVKKYLGNVALYCYLFGYRHHGEMNIEIENIQNVYMQGIIGQDVTNADFSELSQEEFELLKFDENTKFNQETIDRFQPDKILKRKNANAKLSTNNLSKVHVAIIDSTIVNWTNDPNIQIKNYNDNEIARENQDSYHGRSVYSVFRGINPNCVVHYYGTDCENQSYEEIKKNRINAIQEIIEYNKKTKGQKINLVVCSHKLSEEEKNLFAKSNVNVVSSENAHGDFFDYFQFDNSYIIPFDITEEEKKELLSIYSEDPEILKEIEDLQDLSERIRTKSILINKNLTIDNNRNMYNGRTKRHECSFSTSFTVPIIAAYFSLALEKKITMKYEEFYSICKECLREGTNILDETLFEKRLMQLPSSRNKTELTTDLLITSGCMENVKKIAESRIARNVTKTSLEVKAGYFETENQNRETAKEEV